jgi:indolepyruvate ferredoxin oxidoreductase
VGGTGVVTVGALISMAAHLEGKSASVLDFMGFAQKGGSVLSFVRFAARDEWLNQVRIDTQQADVLLACDMVVGASSDALQTVRHGRTRIVVNTHAIPNATFVQNPDANLHADALIDKMRHAAGEERMSSCDAQALATRFLGDTIGANILMLGFAWQLGLVPVSFSAMMRAIELNNVAVQMNQLAFSVGRLAAADPAALEALWQARHAVQQAVRVDTVDELIAHREGRLAVYGGAPYVKRYRALVDAARRAEATLGSAAPDERLTRAVATTFYRLLAVKDEYEVARRCHARNTVRRRSRRRSGSGYGLCSARWRNSADCAARCSIRLAARWNAGWNANWPTTTK